MASGREPDRKILFTCQRTDAVNVVAMLMGNQDGGQRAGLTTEARQAPFGFFQREAAVHQDRSLPAFDQQPIATAAAAKQCEAQLAGGAQP